MRPKTNNESEEAKKYARNLTANLIQDLSLALAAPVDLDRTAIYVDELQDLSEVQIKHAFHRALKSWKPSYGRAFPSIAELREYAEEIDGNSKSPAGTAPFNLEIDPEKLPKGWTVEEWKRAKLTLHVKRESEPAPYDPNATPNETRKDYAARLIAEMRAAVKAGASSFPEDE